MDWIVQTGWRVQLSTVLVTGALMEADPPLAVAEPELLELTVRLLPADPVAVWEAEPEALPFPMLV